MAPTRVALSISDSTPYHWPILEGTVTPRDIKPELHKHKGHDGALEHVLDGSLDVGETSLATFIAARDQGYPVLALPVFTTRRFIQPHIHLYKNSDARDMTELKGKRVGLHLYWSTSSLWARRLLWQMHGIAPKDIVWITSRPERLSTQTYPPGVIVKTDDQGRDTPRLLAEGAVDAVIGLGPGGRPERELPEEAVEKMRRDAYPDVLEAQREYYRKTRVLPLTNVVVMREELAAERPWIIGSLYEAFRQAKEQVGQARAIDFLLPTGHWPLKRGTVKDLHDLVGDDPWPYGIKANRHVLEDFVEGALQEGLIRNRMSVESLFPSDLRD
jgi:4,5-dihydroxyphthalate decarboxylase